MKTEELIKKYHDGSLDDKELELLRGQVNAMDDDELSSLLEADWMSDAHAADTADTRHMKETVWRKILGTVYRKAPSRALRIVSYAAAVLVPVLFVMCYYMYHRMAVAEDSSIVLATGKGEKVQTVLPDGTKVWLNENSRIDYRMADINSKRRLVHFEGEAYFEVAHGRGRFEIACRAVNVLVLGTKFNLSANPTDSVAALSLDEGRVRFTSLKTNDEVNMKVGDVATLHYASGKITLSVPESRKGFTAWKRNEVMLNHVTFATLCGQLRKWYGVEVKVESGNVYAGTFTGVIPTDNLGVAIDIIEHVYAVKTRLADRTLVVIERK